MSPGRAPPVVTSRGMTHFVDQPTGGQNGQQPEQEHRCREHLAQRVGQLARRMRTTSRQRRRLGQRRPAEDRTAAPSAGQHRSGAAGRKQRAAQAQRTAPDSPAGRCRDPEPAAWRRPRSGRAARACSRAGSVLQRSASCRTPRSRPPQTRRRVTVARETSANNEMQRLR